jgi:hypothetical protein
MRWRCAAGIFQRNAVFSRRTSALLHLTICFSRIRWCKRITSRGTLPGPGTYLEKTRFKPLWNWYKMLLRPRRAPTSSACSMMIRHRARCRRIAIKPTTPNRSTAPREKSLPTFSANATLVNKRKVIVHTTRMLRT